MSLCLASLRTGSGISCPSEWHSSCVNCDCERTLPKRLKVGFRLWERQTEVQSMKGVFSTDAVASPDRVAYWVDTICATYVELE